jgi:hypothetical protein
MKYERLLACIRVLCTNYAITDTIWLRDGVTVVEELAALASELGATDAEIEEATATVPTACEHGVPDGDWCEPCNHAYKQARVLREMGKAYEGRSE